MQRCVALWIIFCKDGEEHVDAKITIKKKALVDRKIEEKVIFIIVFIGRK